MDYKETLEYLYRQLPMFSRVGAAAYKPGLDTSLRLDAHFGHPHRRFKTIHVAGTNGKGSCSHSLAAVLQAEGYRTGLYTSPHLADFRERMRINGDMIPRDNVVDFVRRYRESGYEGHPSFFELTMMMAFDWFASERVDVAVIEVGMGGRLDSTNIITPEACVITNISKDHTQFLGDTLEKIAAEKGGIIKSGIPVVVGEAEGEVRRVFADRAAEVGAPIRFAQDEKMFEATHRTDGMWDVTTAGGLQFTFPLGGDYQLANLGTILSAVEMCREAGFRISDHAVAAGLSKVPQLTGLAGRWMRLGESPVVIADTGHNEAGLRYNMAQLRRMMESRRDGRLRIVLGFVADKDVEHIIGMFPQDAEYYLTAAAIPRALAVADLEGYASRAGLKGKAYADVMSAYEAALADAGGDDVVYVGGSTFIVADLLAGINN